MPNNHSRSTFSGTITFLNCSYLSGKIRQVPFQRDDGLVLGAHQEKIQDLK